MKSFRVWILVFAVMISGCAPSAEERTANFTVMPDGLKDCKIYRISDGMMVGITVVRCPNSSTTSSTHVGKTKKTVTTIDYN
jgi:hypothetical protein